MLFFMKITLENNKKVWIYFLINFLSQIKNATMRAKCRKNAENFFGAQKKEMASERENAEKAEKIS